MKIRSRQIEIHPRLWQQNYGKLSNRHCRQNKDLFFMDRGLPMKNLTLFKLKIKKKLLIVMLGKTFFNAIERFKQCIKNLMAMCSICKSRFFSMKLLVWHSAIVPVFEIWDDSTEFYFHSNKNPHDALETHFNTLAPTLRENGNYTNLFGNDTILIANI